LDIRVALLVDAVTGRVVRALDEAEVECCLLRGPAFAHWLYDRPAERTYADLDLLVPRDRFERARHTLRALGFSPLDERWPGHAESWLPPDEWSVPVDLHRTLALVSAPPEEVWRRLVADASTLRVGGVDVRIPGLTATALLAALHAAHHGDDRAHPAVDLERALTRVDLDGWREVAALADALGASAGLAAGLRRLPAGAVVADSLRLTTRRPVEVALRDDGAPAHAIVLENLAAADGRRARLRILAGALVPPAAHVRAGSRLARRGPIGLFAAYVWRAVRLAPVAVPSFRAWRRARASSRA
jgi:hypothetical protein